MLKSTIFLFSSLLLFPSLTYGDDLTPLPTEPPDFNFSFPQIVEDPVGEIENSLFDLFTNLGPEVVTSIDKRVDRNGQSDNFHEGIVRPRFGYKNVLVGPKYRNVFSMGKNKYWRYITFYNKEKVKTKIPQFPIIVEECFDDGDRFADYGQTISWQAELQMGLGTVKLGIHAKIMNRVEFKFGRNLNATEGIEAEHTPYKYSETWKGVTYLQTLNTLNNRISIFPLKSYSDFKLTGVNAKLRVERVITNYCE